MAVVVGDDRLGWLQGTPVVLLIGDIRQTLTVQTLSPFLLCERRFLATLLWIPLLLLAVPSPRPFWLQTEKDEVSEPIESIPLKPYVRIGLPSPACLHVFFPCSLLVSTQVARQCRVSPLVVVSNGLSRPFFAPCRLPLSFSAGGTKSGTNVGVTVPTVWLITPFPNAIDGFWKDGVPFCM